MRPSQSRSISRYSRCMLRSGIVGFVLGMITAMLHFPVGFLMVFLWPVIGIAALIAWIFLMYKAYNNEKYKLPIIGNMVENMIR